MSGEALAIVFGPEFDLGSLAMTPGVYALLQAGQAPAANELAVCVARHASCDWGNVDEHDSATNDAALGNGSRLVSAYELAGEKIWIITEADRSVTTILLPEEY